jgi:hypothetical protein
MHREVIEQDKEEEEEPKEVSDEVEEQSHVTIVGTQTLCMGISTSTSNLYVLS